jgi:hypothetical protein
MQTSKIENRRSKDKKKTPLVSSRLDVCSLLADAVGGAEFGLSINLLYKLRHAEQIVHAFQTKTLGFRHEKPHEQAHDEAEATKHEEHALRGSKEIERVSNADARR